MEAIITIKISEQNHLSDEDKKLIKEVVLYRARCGDSSEHILELGKKLAEAFTLINAKSVPTQTNQGKWVAPDDWLKTDDCSPQPQSVPQA